MRWHLLLEPPPQGRAALTQRLPAPPCQALRRAWPSSTGTRAPRSPRTSHSGYDARAGAYGQYDTEGTGRITEEQFADGEFRRFDRDRDEAWSEGEFETSEEAWRNANPEADFPDMSFDEFDRNDDDVISQDEFRSLWSRRAEATVGGEPAVGSFETYDADRSGDITEDEFAAGEFRRFDWDRDEALNEQEFGRYQDNVETDVSG